MKKFESRSSPEALQEELRDEFGVEDGFDLEDVGDCYDLEILHSGDKVIVGMLLVDTSPQDYFSNDEGAGELLQFRSASDRDDAIEKLSSAKVLMYLVDKYDHGQVHFSISGSKQYPDDRWDVSHGCAIFVPTDYIQSEYRKMKKTDGEESARQHFIKDSNGVLDEYSNWCNGEVYGYSVTTFDKTGKAINSDECWGYIGNDYANQEKRAVMKNVAVSAELDELAKNVVIEKVAPKDIDLPFKIIKKDLVEASVAKVYDTYVVGAKYVGDDNVVIYNWSEGQEKPTKAKFEQWQKDYGVSAAEFLEARMSSDIKDVIRKELVKEEKTEQKLKV